MSAVTSAVGRPASRRLRHARRPRARALRPGRRATRSLPARAARPAEPRRPRSPRLVTRPPARRAASTRCGRTRPRRSTRCAHGRSVVRRHRHRVGQVALLPGADRRVGRRRQPRHRAAGVPHQGARAGPAALASASGSCPTSSPPPTTATPRPTTGRGPASTPTSCSPTPRCCTWGSSRRTSAGRRSSCACATSSSTSCTRCAGVFGSHVAHVLRRLRRLCEHYGSDPTFCFTSATIGNPAELASRLCGLPVEAIDDDGSPQAGAHASRCGNDRCRRALRRARVGERRDRDAAVALRRRRPPDARVHPQPPGAELVAAHARAHARRASCADGARVAGGRRVPRRLPRRRAARARGEAHERRARRCRRHQRARARHRRRRARRGGAQRLPGHARVDVAAGRAGRAHRRDAPRRCSSPATTSSTSGTRASRASCSTRPAEAAVVNPDNPFVARAQIACAAHELPLTHADERWFGDGLDDAVRDLVLDDLLKPRGGRMYWVGREPPAARVGLRTGSSVEYQLVDADGRLVGTVDAARVFHVAHPGAIYLHQGRQYRVRDLDVEHHVAVLEPADDADEHTQPRDETDIAIVADGAVGAGRRRRSRTSARSRCATTSSRTNGKRISTNEVIEVVPLDFPPRELTTRACWYTVPLDVARWRPASNRRASSARCTRPSTRSSACCRCSRSATAGTSAACRWRCTRRPASRRSSCTTATPAAPASPSSRSRELTAPRRAALELVAGCPCDDGCPSCVQSPKCGNWNEYLDKDAAIALLEVLGATRSASRTSPTRSRFRRMTRRVDRAGGARRDRRRAAGRRGGGAVGRRRAGEGPTVYHQGDASTSRRRGVRGRAPPTRAPGTRGPRPATPT